MLLCTATCSNSGDGTWNVVVSLTQLDSRTATVQVAVALEHQRAKSNYMLRADQLPFTLEMPPDSQGELDVSVESFAPSDVFYRQRGSGYSMLGDDPLAVDRRSRELELAIQMHDRCNGAWCTELEAPVIFNGLWGASTQDIWAVGDKGAIYHFDGSGWRSSQPATAKNIHAIWGAASHDIWAAADGGVILHYDGSSWTPDYNTGTSANLTGIWGSSAGRILAVGGTTLLESRGRGWAVFVGSGQDKSFDDVGGVSGDDIWIAGSAYDDHGKEHGTPYHYDGTAWQRVTDSLGIEPLSRLRSDGATMLWASGRQGGLYTYSTGGGWSAAKTPETRFIIQGLCSVGPRDCWAVGTFEFMVEAKTYPLMHWTGGSWTAVSSPIQFTLLSAVWGSGRDLWVADLLQGIYHGTP